MKQLLSLLFALISITAIANRGINFEENTSWAAIKAKAKQEQKMIFLDAYTSWCGPCKFLETTVYTNDSVAQYYNDHFINVKFDMEKGEGIELAAQFDIISFPTLLFFNADGELVHKNLGALQAPAFIGLGKDATDPDKQYFTLKQKVIDRQMSNADFLRWTKLANDLQDKDRGDIAAQWLSAQPDILGSEDLAKATLLYATVTEEQLAYLYKEQNRIQQLLNWDAEKVAAKLYQQLFLLASKQSTISRGAEDAFVELIRAFEPAKVNYSVKKLAIANALNKDNDQAAAMQLILSSLKGEDRLTLKETAMLLFDQVPRFDEEAIKQLSAGLAAYTINANDKGNEGWLYLMQVVCHSRLGENEQARLVAEKAAKIGGLPIEYENFLSESFGQSR